MANAQRNLRRLLAALLRSNGVAVAIPPSDEIGPFCSSVYR
jgi:hypothetical protein